jgi:hypothetical protein
VQDEEDDSVESKWVQSTEGQDAPALSSQEHLEKEMDAQCGPSNASYGLHPWKKPNYNFAVAGIVEENLATPQMSLRQGIKCFGMSGIQAVKKELKQLHDHRVMKVRHKCELTPEKRGQALAYLMFWNRKRCGSVKGRGCADGRPQWTS